MNRKTLRRLGAFLRPYGGKLLALLVLMLAANLLALAAPLLSGWALDAVGIKAGGVDFPGVYRNCGWMLGCYAVSALLNYCIAARLIRVGQGVSHDLRKAAFDHMSELPVHFFDTHPAGDLISRICYDVDTLNAAISTDFLQLATSVLTVAGSFVMLLVISPKLACVFFVTVPLSLVLTRLLMRRIQPLYRLRSKSLGQLNGFAEERVSGQRTIRTYGVEAADLEQFSAYNQAASKAYYQADYAGAPLGPSVNFINNLSLAFISVFGALLYLGGGLTLGALSSFVLYSRKFSGPIREAADLLGELQGAAAAAERVLDLLEEEAEPGDGPDAVEPKNLKGDIRFDHVDFGYTDQPVLRDFCAHIPAGSLAAVVGPTGAGKTTLVSLLLRFYTPQSGSITIDGLPVTAYSRDGLRRRLALVLQDTWLFGGSIAENIAYGAPSATREQVVECAKAAHIHRFISSLPAGYDTVLTDEGAGISKGQRQLLAIARCLLTDADIVILDEATSNVDTETEGEISLAMERLRQGRTCFVIAHRLATIRNADRILVLSQGGAVEQGTHEELLAAGGVYAGLYAAQFD
ncbi:MAG: ABC transporter ATP-binding protein [Oscillibacter sp.]